MGYIKEPKGIDFVVDPQPLTEKDKSLISHAITYYKQTGRKKRITTKKRTITNTKKKLNTKKQNPHKTFVLYVAEKTIRRAVLSFVFEFRVLVRIENM